MRRGEIRWYTFALPDKQRPGLLLTRAEVNEIGSSGWQSDVNAADEVSAKWVSRHDKQPVYELGEAQKPKKK